MKFNKVVFGVYFLIAVCCFLKVGAITPFNTSSTQEMNRGNVGAAYSGTAANPYPNQYNTARSGTILPGYNEAYYMDNEDSQSLNDYRRLDDANTLRRVAPQEGPLSGPSYGSPYGAPQSQPKTPSEGQFMSGLKPEERAIYYGLDPEAKGLALQLSTEGGYSPGIAVKEAQRRTVEKSPTVYRDY